MDGYALFVVGSLVALVLVFLALGKWYPGSGAEQVDWKLTRSPELEAQLELQDIDEMLAANNERRRASGRPEITEDDVLAEIEADERWRREQGHWPES